VPVTFILLALPWILVILYLFLVYRDPPGLPKATAEVSVAGLPLVSVVIPARNEERNIGPCVESLVRSDYPALEILVVDDRSRDATAEVLRGLTESRDLPVRLISGRPLPSGWFGKSWACWQGAQSAGGEVLLFTDADTRHSPDLLRRSVHELMASGADALTLAGRQIMGSFWERLLQPQFFLLLAARYPRTGTPKGRDRWRNAVANGQYLMFRRDAYDRLGGHRVVAGDVVEDVRLAQSLTRAGMRLVVREDQGLRTRMYRSLGGLVEGWSKNIATAALQTTAPWLQPVIFPLSVLVGVTLWLLPPATLLWAGLGEVPETVFRWALLSTGLSLLVWGGVSARMRGNPLYGALYPLSSLMGLYIFLRSWRMGENIRWKGRGYGMDHEARPGEEGGGGSQA
jgi:chlorobactene glucosyltransferase